MNLFFQHPFYSVFRSTWSDFGSILEGPEASKFHKKSLKNLNKSSKVCFPMLLAVQDLFWMDLLDFLMDLGSKNVPKTLE